MGGKQRASVNFYTLPWWARLMFWAHGTTLPSLDAGEHLISEIKGHLERTYQGRLFLTNRRLIAIGLGFWFDFSKRSLRERTSEIALVNIATVGPVTSPGPVRGRLGVGRIDIERPGKPAAVLQTRNAEVVRQAIIDAVAEARMDFLSRRTH